MGLNDLQCALLPAKLKPEDFSLLTKNRQNIMISLIKEEKTLSRLADSLKSKTISTISDSLGILQNRGFIKKDKNKVYSLTKDGKLLTLSLLQPNGIEEKTIREFLDKILKEEFNIKDEEYRREVIENCRSLGSQIQSFS